MAFTVSHIKYRNIYYAIPIVIAFLFSCKKSIPVKIGPVSGATAVCLGEDSVIYTVSTPEAVDYIVWTVPEETEIVSGQGTNTIMVKFGRKTGNICALLYNDGEPVSERACLSVDFGVTGKWCRESNFEAGTRSRAVAFVLGKKGYVTTGYSNSGPGGSNEFFNDLWEYDTETFTWRQLAPFPDTPRIAAICFTIGTKAYVGTGYKGVGGTLDNFFNDFYEYNPASNIWTSKNNVPGSPRQYAFAFSIGNKGYVGSGQYGLGQAAANDFYEYDPATDVWVQKNNFPYPRIASVSFSIGNKGYVGIGQNPINSVFYNDFYEYNPANDTWTPRADFPGAARYSGVGFASSAIGYIGCGFSNSTVYKDIWAYNPITNLWNSLPDMKEARGNTIGFAVDNKIYMGVGNVGPSQVLNDWWVFTQ